ncbi:MAG: hypothetical protein Fur0018_07930 [Anaerolineales bacterium]
MPEFIPDNKIVAIIAGFPRCGTTALYRYLGAHPEICPSVVKETNFLVEHSNGAMREYADLFAHCRGMKVWVEASPAYVFYDGIHKEIHELP